MHIGSLLTENHGEKNYRARTETSNSCAKLAIGISYFKRLSEGILVHRIGYLKPSKTGFLRRRGTR